MNDFLWNTELSKAIHAVGEAGFEKKLENALKGLVPYDFMVMFRYRGDETPVVLYDSFTPAKRDIHVTKYVEGPYLLDPFFQACRARTSPGLYRLKEIAPDRFYQSEYYRSYYRKTNLAEEIGFLISLPKSQYVVISLMRMKKSSAFSGKELRRLQDVEKIVSALSLRHWKILGAGFFNQEVSPDQTVIRKRIDEVLRTFGKSVLTVRECEVVGLVLRGYSSEAIADILSIAKGTVKTYRRSIYAKLGISSQSELFSLFISALQITPPVPGSD
jgi:DNA-binding CsgD family transcriptional regulator